MHQARAGALPPQKQRRRVVIWRFSLITLLLTITLLSIWLGSWTESARRQRNAKNALEELGANVRYDYELEPATDYGIYQLKQGEPESHVSSWLVDRLGVDFFHEAKQVWLWTDDPFAAVPQLKRMPYLREVIYLDLDYEPEIIERLQRVLPGVTFTGFFGATG
jgi:hypothetical protein